MTWHIPAGIACGILIAVVIIVLDLWLDGAGGKKWWP